MKSLIHKETINNMIHNSTWVSKDNNIILNFSNDRTLSINGKKHSQYCLSHADNRIVIQIGAEKSYYIDYVDDFTLNFYNNQEKYRITPE